MTKLPFDPKTVDPSVFKFFAKKTRDMEMLWELVHLNDPAVSLIIAERIAFIEHSEGNKEIILDEEKFSEILDFLEKDAEKELALMIASNPCTTKSTLGKLAKHHSEEVPGRVAIRYTIAYKTLIELSGHPSPIVRNKVAENRRAKRDIFLNLINHSYESEKPKLFPTIGCNSRADLAVLTALYDQAIKFNLTHQLMETYVELELGDFLERRIAEKLTKREDPRLDEWRRKEKTFSPKY